VNKYKTLAPTPRGSAGDRELQAARFSMARFHTGYLCPADYGTADLLTQTADLLIPVFSLGIADGVFAFPSIGRAPQKEPLLLDFSPLPWAVRRSAHLPRCWDSCRPFTDMSG